MHIYVTVSPIRYIAAAAHTNVKKILFYKFFILNHHSVNVLHEIWSVKKRNGEVVVLRAQK